MSTTTTDIYNGLTLIGYVTERDKGRRCEAYDASGQSIGVFTSPQKAAAAVCEADRERQHGVVA